MGGVHQSAYSTNKEIALSWWRSLPAAVVQVAAIDEKGNRRDASLNCFHETDSCTLWEVWREGEADSKIMIDAYPMKNQPTNWEMNIHWHFDRKSVNRITAAIVEKTLVELGVVCTFDPIQS